MSLPSHRGLLVEQPTNEDVMGSLVTHMAMSLDGYVADENDGIDELFGWYFSGDVAVPTAKEGVSFQTDESSAEVLRGALTRKGALITGRRQFDMTNGWV